jgi:hypothetical protein
MEAVATIKPGSQNAFAMLFVGYVKGAQTATVIPHGHAFEIVEILVVVGNHGNGWQRIAPVLQYTLFPGE